ncbi:MAG: HAD family hydrolase [Oscillospiraceae bacterium]|nr:HAD family hydrolase [Oscillospiraceae bacterium]
MRISFDLDDTLFVNSDKFAVEKPLRFPLNRLFKERLRLGTIDLLEQLRSLGIEVWIYTTSFRSERYIRGLFRCYGIRLDGVVNGKRHAIEVQSDKREPMPSKYPSKYKIDLHIDDDISVKQNGDTYGFRVMIIGENDSDWTRKIIKRVEQISQSNL